MDPSWKAPVAVALAVVAVSVLVAGDVLSWGLSIASAGLLGSIAGGGLGYLVKSPGEQAKLVEVLREGTKAIAATREPSESPSDAELPK